MFPHMSVEKRFLSSEAGFPLDLLDIWGGGGVTSARNKVLMEGLMRGGGGHYGRTQI